MHNRIDVQNDPVNWVDPWGLEPGETCTNIGVFQVLPYQDSAGIWSVGHAWIEIGKTNKEGLFDSKEAYGWYPKPDALDTSTNKNWYWSYNLGVPGELNGGYKNDPYWTMNPKAHTPDFSGYPVISSKPGCECMTCEEAANCIRNKAKTYGGEYSANRNCMDFRDDILSACCLEKPRF